MEVFLSKMEEKARNLLAWEEKKFILANHKEVKSYSEIAGIIRRSKSVVHRVISRFKADKKPNIENWQASYDYQIGR